MTLYSRILSDIFLHPGDFAFAAAPDRIGTLLGSCVAVTIWHPDHRIGGMCHVLLPERNRPADSLPDGRYADEAVELISNEITRRGIPPASCHVRLFGGGNMLANLQKDGLHIGKRNVRAVRDALRRHGFTPRTEHVGGTAHRRLVLDLKDGKVFLLTAGNADLIGDTHQ